MSEDEIKKIEEEIENASLEIELVDDKEPGD